MGSLLWHGLRDSARRHPDRPAVEWRGEVLSYRELDQWSDGVAAALRSAGIGPSHRVGLYTPKTHKTVISMLGISKSGAAYVPLEPYAPPERAAELLRECAVSAIVTSSDRLEFLAEHQERLPLLRLALLTDSAAAVAHHGWVQRRPIDHLHMAGDPAWPVTHADEPAYLLFTSGASGAPRGAVLTHRNARTFAIWGAQAFGVGPEDRLANHAPLHSHLSVFDLHVALHAGACVVLVPDPLASLPAQLARWIAEHRITLWHSEPSALIQMLLHGTMAKVEYPTLRSVLLAGEVFPRKPLRQVMSLLPHTEFYNLYSCTEANACTWYHVPHSSGQDATAIPIGTACGTLEVFAVDPAGHPTGVGETGELVVRGPTVMAGYWQGAEQAVVTPRGEDGAGFLFYTGDLVRLGEDGNYWLIGRCDTIAPRNGEHGDGGSGEETKTVSETGARVRNTPSGRHARKRRSSAGDSTSLHPSG